MAQVPPPTVPRSAPPDEAGSGQAHDPGPSRPIPRGVFSARPPNLAERALDVVRDWRADRRFGVAVLVVVAVVAGVVWYRIGIAGGGDAGAAPRSEPIAERPVTTSGLEAPATTAVKASGRIAVHVAGAVISPGVVELRAGARVIDAVEAVGGAHADGDLDRLNLAARLVDGQRVYVPKAGEADPGVSGVAGGGDGMGDASSADPTGAVPGGKLDLNLATQAQLEALPGIGPVYAQAIIAERQRRGGFKSVNELRSVRGIGEKRFAELAPLVTV